MRAWLSVLLMALAVPAGADLRAPAIKGRGSVPIYVGVPTLAQVVCGGVTNGSVCGGSGGGGGISFGGSTGGTNTRVPFTDGSGLLADDADLTFSTDTLTATKLIVPTLGTFGASSGAASSIDISTAGIVFEGLTANASETTLGAVDPTADVTFNLQTATAGTYRLTAQTNAALTSGRVPIATTDGMLADDSDLTFATDTLTVTKLSVPTIELGSAATDTTITRSAAGVVAVEGVDLASISGAQSITGKTFPSFELGTAATDTTITRSGAGIMAIEGVEVLTASSTATVTGKTLRAPNGSCAAPPYSFNADSTRGMMSSATIGNSVDFCVGGAVMMNIGNSGVFSYTRWVEAQITTYTTTLADSHKVFTNTGDTDGSTITLLNNPTVGASYTFAVTAAFAQTFQPSSGELLYGPGGASCSTMTCAVVGCSATVTAVTGGSGGIWMTTGYAGTWGCT